MRCVDAFVSETRLGRRKPARLQDIKVQAHTTAFWTQTHVLSTSKKAPTFAAAALQMEETQLCFVSVHFYRRSS
jgi:hypothetical protein